MPTPNPTIPPVPQTGRRIILMPIKHEEQMLSQRHEHDRTDPFASDPDENVRRLGRLALRRPVPEASDAFVLGDLCAKLSLRDDTLLITYVGKALIAYRRAGKQSPRQADRELAARSVEAYIEWTVQTANILHTPRNIAVALWAAADLTVDDQPEWLRKAVVKLADSYSTSLPPRPADRETVEAPAVNLRGTVESPIVPNEAPPFVDPAESLLNQYEASAHADDDDLPHSLLQPLSNLAADPNVDYQASPDDPVDSDMLPPDDRDMLPTTPFQLPSANDPTSDLMPPPSAPSSRKPPKVIVRPMDDETGDYKVYDWLVDHDPRIQGKRYEIRRILRGGMGIIYICRDHHSRDAVAIKTFQGRFLSNDRAAARFEQEALAWMRLEKHPNIVQARKVQRFGDEHVAERPHIILEYISPAENLTADLKSWIEAGALSLETTLRIALDVCRGMLHATSMIPGLVHRDLKPGNILVSYDGVAKVTDFGLVRTLDRDSGEQALDESPDDRLTRAGAIVGTAAYMSPEQTRAQPTDVRSDIYSFGAILYEMVTRTQVFKARTFDEWLQAHRTEIPRFPESLPIRAPIPLRRLIMDCLDKQPNSRPPTWSVVMRELSAIYEQELARPVPAINEAELEIEELMDKAYGLSELGYHEEAVSTYDRALELAPASDYAWIWGRKANTLRFSGDFEAAHAAFEQALNLDPAQAWLWHAQGVLLERMGKPAEALESYQKALVLRPTDQRFLLSVARQLNAAGQFEAALGKLDEVLAVAPTLAEAYAERAMILARLARHDEALATYERALELRPSDGWSWYGKAKVLRRLKRPDEAVAAVRTATERLPNSKWSWLLLADLEMQMKHFEDGLEAITHVTQLDPEFADGWRKQGLLLDAVNRPDDALAAFNLALQLQPTNIGAVEAKLRVLQKLQRHQDALAALDQSLSAAPESEPLLRRKLESLLVLGQDLEAALVLDKLTTLNPTEGTYWGMLGKARRRLKQPAQAETALRRALDLMPDAAPLWNDLGLLLASAKRAEEALTCFESALQLDHNKPWYWYNKANTLYALDRYLECLEALEGAFTHNERFLDGWLKRGQALRKLGRFKEALDALNEAIEIAPNHGWAWNQRGLVLADSGRHADALASYAQAVKLDASNVWFHLNQVDPLLALGRREEALAVAETAASLQPASTVPLIRQGAVLRLMDRHEEALAVYERALALNPKEYGGWYGKARALSALNRSTEALASLARLTAYYPGNASVWVWYGDLLLEHEQARDALAAFNQALLLDPGNTLAQRRRDEAKKQLAGG